MNRTEKAEQVARLRERFDRMVNAIVTDYHGLDVGAMTELRRQFRKAAVEFKVVKNTLVKRAVEGTPYAAQLARHLQQMTGIAWSYDDASSAAKVIRDFNKQRELAKLPQELRVKCGVMDGAVSSAQGWADLPSREQLLAAIAGQLLSAPQALVAQMVTPAQQLISLMDAWTEKLEKEGQGESR